MNVRGGTNRKKIKNRRGRWQVDRSKKSRCSRVIEQQKDGEEWEEEADVVVQRGFLFL
jgi:hypothetical protein